MLLVKTKIGPSKIEGIGLFAAEPIKAGTKVWKFEPQLDLVLSKEEAEKLSPSAHEQFHRYAYLDMVRNKYLLCGDDGRFFNHSETPNCDEARDNESTFAIKDIDVGEELTINYGEFYGNMDEHPEIEQKTVAYYGVKDSGQEKAHPLGA
ncbi:MAG: SET domain-containing protein [Candidatus Taylorbacteria bacterium]|nr:SET domain-containing protein [Candidatus Taylorbacteria bacterium]